MRLSGFRLRQLAWVMLYVVFPLDLLFLFVNYLPVAQTNEVCGIALFICSSILLNLRSMQSRIHIQRRVFNRFRRDFLKLSDKRLAEIPHDAWTKFHAWVVLPRALLPGAFAIVLADVIAGNWGLGLRNVRVTLTLMSMIYLDEKVHAQYFSWIQTLYQILALAVIPRSIVLVRRAMLVRAIMAAATIEDLIDTFVQFIPLAFWSMNFSLPIGLFLCLVLPVELFGFRALIVGRLQQFRGPVNDVSDSSPPLLLAIKRNSRPSKLLLYLVTSVPVVVLGFSLTNTVPRNQSPLLDNTESYHPGLRLALAGFFFAVASFAMLGQSHIDEFVHPTVLRNQEKGYFNKTSAPVGFSMMYFSWALTVLVCLRYSTGCYFVLSLPWVHCLKADQRRTESAEEPSKAVLLSLARASLALDDTAAISDVIFEVGVVSFVQVLLVAPGPAFWMVSASLVSLSSLVLALANASGVEGNYRLLEAVRKSENFLDHAIKQKYSAVGSALDGILDRHAEMFDNSDELVMLRDTIEKALFECYMGRDICHMSASVRKAMVDRAHIDLPPTYSLISLVNEWEVHCVFNVIIREDPKLSQVNIQLDKELLRALLCSMAEQPGASTLAVRLKSPLDEFNNPGPLQLEFSIFPSTKWTRVTDKASLTYHRESKAFLSRLHRAVVNLLGGVLHGKSTLVFNVASHSSISLEKHFPAQFTSPVLRSTAPLAMTSSPGVSSTLCDSDVLCRTLNVEIPPNLSFAVLDDNDLVRSNTMKTLLRHAVADERKSFASGRTSEEAMFFPHLICSKGIQVAILDQNLDYDVRWSSTVSGTELGRVARERGFDGCLILHSANGDLSSSLDPCFDGFIEKSAKRQDFLQGLRTAWSRHVQRTNLVKKV